MELTWCKTRYTRKDLLGLDGVSAITQHGLRKALPDFGRRSLRRVVLLPEETYVTKLAALYGSERKRENDAKALRAATMHSEWLEVPVRRKFAMAT
jgi:hypothetical protein